jgi:uncharacterized protein YidB (DUF937 family)
VARSKTRRYLAGAALLVGGLTVGALFSPIGLASAQSDDTTDQDTSESDDSTKAPGFGLRDRKGPPHLESVAELLGITVDELREGLRDGSTMAEMAEANGVSTEELTAEILASIEEHLDEAVADGRIDQEKADERLAGAEERVETMINAEPGTFERFGKGHGHSHRVWGRADHLQEVADSLGLSVDDLKDSLADGQTVVEAAEAQGVSEADLVAALVEAATEQIDEAVEDGRLDADRAATMKESLEENITDRVNREPEERGGGYVHTHPHRHGPGRFGQWMGPKADADADVEADVEADVDADGELQESSFSA